MGGKPAPNLVIAQIAERRGGVVSRSQLRAAGLTARMIDRRLAAGTLRVVHRGVYALAERRLDRPALHHAAWLAVGDQSAVSHADAAGSWAMRRPARGSVHLTLPGKGGRDQRRGMVLHRARLLPGDAVRRDGLRITSPGRTLVDVATVLERRDLERALDEAHYRGLVSRSSLAEALQRNAGRRGVRALRAILAGHELGSTRTESELEEAFVRAYRARGRFPFRCQVPLPPYRADLLFADQRVIVEVDGPAHRSRRRQAGDAVRDAALAERGFNTIRVSDEEIDADVHAAVARVDRQLSAASPVPSPRTPRRAGR